MTTLLHSRATVRWSQDSSVYILRLVLTDQLPPLRSMIRVLAAQVHFLSGHIRRYSASMPPYVAFRHTVRRGEPRRSQVMKVGLR